MMYDHETISLGEDGVRGRRVYGARDSYILEYQLKKGWCPKYLAVDSSGKEKIIKLPNPDAAEQHINEKLVLRALSHPRIVKPYDTQNEDDSPFLVLEYVDGMNLEKYLGISGVLPFGFCREIFIEVCGVLEYIHGNGLVHRDIKPSNIILQHFGGPVIIDFELCTQSGYSDGDMMNGTYVFMSPEQLFGGPIEAPSDIYNIGISLYELLTGKTPFEEPDDSSFWPTFNKLTQRKISEEIENPQGFNPKIPNGFADIILKATRKNPKDRFQAAAELREALLKLDV